MVASGGRAGARWTAGEMIQSPPPGPTSTRRALRGGRSAPASRKAAGSRRTPNATIRATSRSSGGAGGPPRTLPMSSVWIQVSNRRWTRAVRSGCRGRRGSTRRTCRSRAPGVVERASRSRWSAWARHAARVRPGGRPRCSPMAAAVRREGSPPSSSAGSSSVSSSAEPSWVTSSSSVAIRWATRSCTVQSWTTRSRHCAGVRRSSNVAKRSTQAAYPVLASSPAAGRRATAAARTAPRSRAGGGTASVVARPAAARPRRSASAAQDRHPARWSSTVAASSSEQASSAQAPSSSVTAAWPSFMGRSLQPAGGRRARAALARGGTWRSPPGCQGSGRPAGTSARQSMPGGWPRPAPRADRPRPPGPTWPPTPRPPSPQGPARRSVAPRRRCGDGGPSSAAPSRRRDGGSWSRANVAMSAGRIERPWVLPHPHEHLLGDVLGGRPVAGHPDGQAIHQRRELVVQLPQCRLVTGHEAFTHLLVPPRMRGLQLLHPGCSFGFRSGHRPPAFLDGANATVKCGHSPRPPTEPSPPRVRTVGTDAHSNEVMTMRSTVRRMVRVQLRLAVAGAVVLAALTAATAGASAATTRGRTGGETAPRTPVPGFLLDRGRFMRFDAPTAGVETGPNSIDNRGRIVGFTIDDDVDATYHGFLRDARGRFTPIDLPGAKATVASRINDRGQIVGRYYQTTPFSGPDARFRGFLLDHGRLTRIDVPGAAQTQAVGVNNLGRVVGEYRNLDGTYHGFVWHKGRSTTIDLPGAAGTSPADINDRGQIVGSYVDTAGGFHGFLLDRGRVTTIDAPGVTFTLPRDINNRGQIAGSALDDPVTLAGA